MERSVAAGHASVLATNKVIRNTYMLLTLTLLTSTVTAFVAMQTNAGFINPILMLVVFIGMPLIIYKFRNSGVGLLLTFAFTGLMGYILGPILNYYLGLANGGQIVAGALGSTAVVFLGLSGYALTTQKNFNFMGGFLFVGFLVVIGAILLNLFLQIPALSLTISAAAVMLISAAILYDTSRMVHGGETNYIVMTVALYANIYVLFTHLLNLFAFFNSND